MHGRKHVIELELYMYFIYIINFVSFESIYFLFFMILTWVLFHYL